MPALLRSLWRGTDRRSHRRLEASFELRVEVELYGFEDEVRPFFASGKTINVSRGGLLAVLDAPVSAGSVCNIFFRDAGDQLRPHHVTGQVVRSFEEEGEFHVGVQFDEPLLRLEVDRIQEAGVGAG